MKKKILPVMLAVTLACGLISCGKTDKSAASQGGSDMQVWDGDEIPELNASEASGTSEGTLFEQFINGEIEAEFDDDNIYDLVNACVSYEEVDGTYQRVPVWDGAKSFSIEDLAGYVKATPDLDTSYVRGSYAVMDTMPGGQVLVVKFTSIGIERFENDDSCAYFVFAEDGGKLTMTYAADSWSRNYVGFHDKAVLSGFGSGGAGDSIEQYGYIDEKGHYKTAAYLRMLYETWVGDYVYDKLQDYGLAWSEGCTMAILDTEDGKYYALDSTGVTEQAKLDKLCEIIEAEGRTSIASIADAEAKAEEALSKAGISKDTPEFDGWTPLPGTLGEGPSTTVTGKTVYPSGVNIVTDTAGDTMPDGTYDVAFGSADVFTGSDGISVKLQFYNYDCYDAAEIDSIEPGDGIVVLGETIVVNTVERGRNVNINGGYEGMNGVTLKPEDGYYRTMVPNDYPYYYTIGTGTLLVDKNCQLYDVSDYNDPEAPPIIYGYSDMPGCFGANGVEYYTPGDTVITVKDNLITNITRRWTP